MTNEQVSVLRSPAVGQRFWTIGLVVVVMLTASAPRSIQPDGVKKAEHLSAKVLELFEIGQFDEAILLAQEALTIRKTVLGPRHPATAASLNNLARLYGKTGAYAQAQPLLEEALAIFKEVLGPRHLDTAISLNDLAELYGKTGAYAQAQPLLEEAVAIFKEVLGPRHPETATSLHKLALLYQDIRAYSKAEPLLEEVLAIFKEVRGARHPDTATSLSNLALLYQDIGAYSKAQVLLDEALAIRKEVLGVRHPDTATGLRQLALVYQETRAYAQARPLLEEALAIHKEMLGPRHPATAASLNSLARLYERTGEYAQAQPLFEEALAIQKEVLGPRHPGTATSLSNLALLYQDIGAYAQAQPLLEEVLAIRKEVLGMRHPDTVTSLSNLASVYERTGAYVQAQLLLEEALRISKEVRGGRHPDTASSLRDLGTIYRVRGAYVQAQPLLEEALRISKEVRGARHPDTATSLRQLALVYQETGAYAQAQPLLEEALAISREVQGPRHSDTATSLSNLGGFYVEIGAYAQAQPLLEEALAIRKEVLGPKHPDTAMSLNDLALLYGDVGANTESRLLLEQAFRIYKEVSGLRHPATLTGLNNLAVSFRHIGAYAQAKPLLEEAIALHREVFGPLHTRTAVSLSNLALLYQDIGVYAQARPLLEEALAIFKEVHGARHRYTAVGLHNLAMHYDVTGAYGQAEPLLKESVEIVKDALGPNHPDLAKGLTSLALLAWKQDQRLTALQHLRTGAKIEETNLRALLAKGKESRKRAYMATLEGSMAAIMSFVGATASLFPPATSLGLEVVLQRKGRVLDVLAENLTRIRRSATPEDQALWARYVAAQADWAAMILRGPGRQPVDQYRARLDELAQQADKVATELSSRSSQFQAVLEPITLAQVQRAIPPGSILLEWVRYHPFNPKAVKLQPSWGTPRYAVYVLKPHGAPAFVDVGEAKALEEQVEKLLAAVKQPGRGQAMQVLARDLYRQLIQPVQAHLGSATTLFFSPDGQLNLLPFGVLQGMSGRSLADQYELTYLTSGRDLLRPTIPAGVARPSLLVADPAFDASIPATQTDTTAASPSRSADIDRDGIFFNRLPGTAQEARDLSLLLKLAPSQVLTGAQATEAAVKQVQSPKILHLATHGFFLNNLSEAFPSTWRGVSVEFGERLPAPQGEHPLLRSGLALAGANQRQSGTDDGILTALEVANLDLTGTQLAVLSACETGVGDVRNGEGVYGLRRALVLAGVRTQVVSLWKVDDAATQAFMGHYYRSILNGMGRSAALRATQQKMRHDPKHPEWADPYYWAAFVVIGDGSPLPRERLASTGKARQ